MGTDFEQNFGEADFPLTEKAKGIHFGTGAQWQESPRDEESFPTSVASEIDESLFGDPSFREMAALNDNAAPDQLDPTPTSEFGLDAFRAFAESAEPLPYAAPTLVRAASPSSEARSVAPTVPLTKDEKKAEKLRLKEEAKAEKAARKAEKKAAPGIGSEIREDQEVPKRAEQRAERKAEKLAAKQTAREEKREAKAAAKSSEEYDEVSISRKSVVSKLLEKRSRRSEDAIGEVDVTDDSVVPSSRKPKKILIFSAAAAVATVGGYFAVGGGSAPVAAPPVAPSTVVASTPSVPDSAVPDNLALSDATDAGDADTGTASTLASSESATASLPVDNASELSMDAPMSASVSSIKSGSVASTTPGTTPGTIPGTIPDTIPGTMPAATVPATTTTLPAPVAGRLVPGACIRVVGSLQTRTHRVAQADVTAADCSKPHNAEVVSQLNGDEASCEPAVVAFVGIDPALARRLTGTGLDYALVQDKVDNASYCVASFPNLPDYTGQIAGSQAPRQ